MKFYAETDTKRKWIIFQPTIDFQGLLLLVLGKLQPQSKQNVTMDKKNNVQATVAPWTPTMNGIPGFFAFLVKVAKGGVVQRCVLKLRLNPGSCDRKKPSNNKHSHRIHGTGIFTYIYHKNQANVGKYTIHGSYGI